LSATAPVTDAERERIRQLHARGLSCGEIAAGLGRNKSTITRQCRKLGLSFAREQTKAATDAKVADAKARRAEAVRLMMDDWHRIRERAWSAYEVVMSSGVGVETVFLARPPAHDVRAFYAAMSGCIKDQLAIERHDADEGGLSAVDAWLRGMLGEAG
jgi:hypothetical protein